MPVEYTVEYTVFMLKRNPGHHCTPGVDAAQNICAAPARSFTHANIQEIAGNVRMCVRHTLASQIQIKA